MKFIKFSEAGLVGMMVLWVISAEGITFDTTSLWNGTKAQRWFGVPNSKTYGETFIAPDISLDSFTFNMKGALGSTHLDMTAVVYNWSDPLTGAGGGAVGSPLYVSHNSIVYTGTAWEAITVNPGIALIPGHHYVMAFTLADPVKFAASQGNASFGLIPVGSGIPTEYGGFVFFNSDDVGADSLAGTWSGTREYGSLAFTAVFSNTLHPETVPDGGASLCLLGLGVAVVVSVRRKL